ncbi:MAG TPA: serine/threonine-protein kinase [Myxococcales bacterium]|nr:serine/threonine-protein kinase [Myxococcales bacterium]
MAKVGKYELVRKLATGGMAEVFLAKAEWARGVERTVVVKRILSHLAEDQNFVDMFLSEAKLAAQLSHPNIVQIFEFGETEGVYYLAMEYVDGPNLRTLAARAHERGNPIDFRLCAKMISASCEALCYAHDLTDPTTGTPLQLVHRDISPDNIILARNGSVKVVDFGIAKAVTQSHQTKTGLIKGKLAYMAPEQLKTKGIDRRADVYALGVVLYELVAGAKPYDAESEVTMMHAVLYEPMVPIRQRRPDIPEELEQIVNKALAHDRDERYPDCRTFGQDLERFIMTSGHDPVGAFEISKLISELQAQPVGGPASQIRGVATPSAPRGTTTPGPERRESTPPQPAGVAEPVALKSTGTEGQGQAPILLTGNLIASALLGTPEGEARQAPPPPQAPPPAARGRARAEERSTEPEMPAIEPEPHTVPSAPRPAPKREKTSPPAKVKAKEPPPRVPEPREPGKPRSKVPVIAAGAGLVAVLAAVGVVMVPRWMAKPPPLPPPPVTETTPPPVETPVAQNTPPVETTSKDPVKDPGPTPDNPTQAPTPPVETTPAAEGALLVLKSDPAARIKVFAGKRLKASARSPLNTHLAPGKYEVEVSDEAQGILKRTQITLKGDAMRETISVGKGMLQIPSPFPWATVSVDGQTLGPTPQQKSVYEGVHTVNFDCSNGKKDVQKIEVGEGATVKVKGKCS